MRRRRITPDLERIEARELLSGLTATLGSSNLVHPTVADLASSQAASAASAAASTGNNSSPQTTPAIIFPIVPGPGNPTPLEQARTRFHASFSGPLYVGAPHYTGQSKILYIRGLGSSTQFLHGDFQMAIVIPKDPAAPITAAAYMQDKNINSSGALGLDMVADPTSLDKQGRPTRLTFANDPNIYSGVDFFFQASGTVRIRYFKDSANVAFDGNVFTNGITNPLRNQDIQARGGRVVPRGK